MKRQRDRSTLYALRSTFDLRRSLILDGIIIALEAQPGPLRRWWLRLLKRWHERHIPRTRYDS